MGETVWGQGDVVGAVALGVGARHVVGDGDRVVGGRRGVEGPATRHPAAGPRQ